MYAILHIGTSLERTFVTDTELLKYRTEDRLIFKNEIYVHTLFC